MRDIGIFWGGGGGGGFYLLNMQLKIDILIAGINMKKMMHCFQLLILEFDLLALLFCSN